ncbi:hypothetical protein J132_00242 [Termitomyces sp. J132]|nr:hypothetical protein J132_00242 [Termitomyces sp. J132]
MSTEIANSLGLSSNPNIVLNMQSANRTLDQSLGLACNVPYTIGNLTLYLQIHILWSPAYDILLGHPFDILTRSMVNTLIKALQDAKPLVPIDYELPNPVILVVDMSYIAIGHYLCQCSSNNCKECCYNHFGPITLNDKESRFSQPKLELYGLYHALIIEVNAHYIKSMLQNSDIQPSASMNCWIMVILMFYFELVHVKGTFHGPDGLLQCLLQPSTLSQTIATTLVSGYNKHANGIIKQFHFDVCQALFKAVNSDQSRWSTATYSVFWSECVTVCKQMGCSPYYTTTSTYPLLPADIVEVTYLQPPPNSFLSSTNLIAC